jgi:hypothetical protein
VPHWNGAALPGYFTASEYTGGYDHVALGLPPGGDKVVVALYYQTTSREYVEFLRDEINGSASSLPSPTPSGEPNAYVIQTDPFFGALKAWGNTVWDLWLHNKDVPGAAPILMTQSIVSLNTCQGKPNGTVCDDGNFCTTGDICSSGICQTGSPASCDDQDPCTDDSCKPKVGCLHDLNTATCETGDLCDGPDVCAYGVCITGPNIFCNDGDPCTEDTCNPATGCVFVDTCGAGGSGGTGGSGGGMGGAGGGMGGSGGAGGGAAAGGNGSAGAGGAGANGNKPSDEGGCGCKTPGSGAMPEGGGILAMIALFWAMQRRRRDRGRSYGR